MYLHATSTTAGLLLICPRDDQAMHSHLNLSFPKYSSTISLVILIFTSTFRIPVCGSTNSDCCLSSELPRPLHLKDNCNACIALHCNVAGLFFITYVSIGSSKNMGKGRTLLLPSRLDEVTG